MAKRKTPVKATDREKKWGKIFEALVKLSQKMQNDRQFLEERIKFLTEVIYKMRMEQKVESLKAELRLSLKDREAVVYKHRYESTEDDLADFREWFEYLAEKCLGTTDSLNNVSNKGEGLRNKALQDEVWKLKLEFDAYKLEKNSEISAILAEKNFLWNQFKKMESDFTEQLKKKSDEVELANEKVQVLVNRAEELQMSNEKLRTDFTKLESESVQKSEELSKLLKEIKLLKSRSGSGSPSLRPCRSEAPESSRKSSRRGKTGVTNNSVTIVKIESDPSKTIEKTTRPRQSAHKSTGGKAPKKSFITSKGSSRSKSNSKRKADDVITIPDTPRLFNTSFKVPKLKSSSSPRIV